MNLSFPGASNADSFEEIYEKYYGKVYNYVYQMILHRQNAEDVVSETFFKAMRAYSRYDRSKGAVSTWLCEIAHNCAIDFFRSQATRSHLSFEELMENGKLPEDTSGEWGEETAEWKAWEILSLLCARERELLSWRYFLGLSNREIALKLNISEKAVGERFRRLLAKCRNIVKND